ncbi:LPXTG cell wall anchor domain-containing protein [Neobacillus niacini]|uniref:LPXTG cell wall anchor domain-containing protein n=1 Tax=Neobacillus niacini TaxID=86668 RepID=UPI003B020F2B
MLKKLLLTALLLHTFTMGLNVTNVMAEGNVEEPVVSEQDTEDLTNSNELQSESANSEETSFSEEQFNSVEEIQDPLTPSNEEQKASEGKIDQDQSADTSGNQDQNVTEDIVVDQDQQVTGSLCQEQSVHATISCEEKLESNVEGNVDQSQTTKVEAGQQQNGLSSGAVEAEQNQNLNVDAEQVQEVAVPAGENSSHGQQTNASSSQKQTVSAEDQTLFVQNQLVDIAVNQRQQLSDTNKQVDELKQQTAIEALQSQNMTTSGSAKMEQTQTAEVKGSAVDALKKVFEAGVVVTSRNYIEIVKDTAANFVKVIQEIFVNDELVDSIHQDYNVDEIGIQMPHQTYQKDYDWGSIFVQNLATINYNEPLQVFNTSMTSFLSVVFGIERSCACSTKPNEEDNETPVTPPPGDNEQTPPSNGDDNNGETPVTPPPSENEQTPPGNEDDNNGETPVTPPPGENEPTPPGNGDGNNGETPVTSPPGENEPTPPGNGDGNTNETPVTPAPEQNEEKPVVTPVVNDVQKSAPSVTVVKTAAVPSNGNSLPDTATNSYNYLILGAFLVAAGALFFNRRKRA